MKGSRQLLRLRLAGRALGMACLLSATALAAQAQAFSGARQSPVDYTRAEHAPKRSCARLGGFKGKDILSITATAMPATASTPAWCRVTGTIKPEVDFEVALPQGWNGRFYMIGNGGHAGESLEDAGRTSQRDAALALGFAFAQTNTGHDSRREPGGTFVLGNPQKATDYAYRAVHVTASTARNLVKEYYGRQAERAYWNSCSNGGRQGLVEAQRYPDDFDGILANAPWVDQTGFMLGAIWNQQALAAAPLTAGKMATVAARVMQRCDAVDGLADGLIDDPRKCDFDARRDVPACPAGNDADSCLTPAQATTVNRIHSGPVDSRGRSLFPGFMPGSEAVVTAANGTSASAWMGMIVPATPDAKPAVFSLGENTLRYLVLKPPQPDYDTMRFDFDRDPRLVGPWAAQANATSTNLDRLRRRGGKVLMTYGWADQILQPMMGVNYYEALLKRYGKATGSFARLFMVPGMTHCSGGLGTDRFDAMTALINWVEAGEAPESLAGSRVVDNKVVRTRPLCPYPQVARYNGSGSIDEAANFSCAAP
ncbi:MAG TPA: tannase/feruloyl esterase family alpha/beta hydrolase [Steroidobacteraceae bacterium]|nr:tannase/feruloyl esterase family alpha/beta hydrolase [Steroidobacteraceae bacterium]